MRTQIKLTPNEVWKILMAHFKEKGKIPKDVTANGWECDIDRGTPKDQRYFAVWFDVEIPDSKDTKEP